MEINKTNNITINNKEVSFAGKDEMFPQEEREQVSSYKDKSANEAISNTGKAFVQLNTAEKSDPKNIAKLMLDNGYDTYDIKKVLKDSDEDFREILTRLIGSSSLNGDESEPLNPTPTLMKVKELYNDNPELVTELSKLNITNSDGTVTPITAAGLSTGVKACRWNKPLYLELMNMKNNDGSNRFSMAECYKFVTHHNKRPRLKELIDISVTENGTDKKLLSYNAIDDIIRDEAKVEVITNPEVQNILKGVPEGSVQRIQENPYFKDVYSIGVKDGNKKRMIDVKITNNNARYVGEETTYKTKDGKITKRSFPNGTKVVDVVQMNNKDRLNGYKKTFYDSEGRIVYSEVLAPTPIAGEYSLNIYERTNGGYKKHEAAKIKTTSDGKEQKVERNITSFDEINTKQVKSRDENSSRSEYVITDKEGNIMFKEKRSRTKISENVYKDSVDEDNYLTEFIGDNIIVSKVDKNDKPLETIKLTSDKLDPDLKDLYKQISGDYLFRIHQMDLTINKGGMAKENNACFRMYPPESVAEMSPKEIKKLGLKPEGLPPGIDISEEVANDPFIAMHELGHAMDCVLFKGLSCNPELEYIYNSELKDYKQKASNSEGSSIDYFTEKDDDELGISETIAETTALISGTFNPNNEHYIGARSIILQHNFPKTIAFIANAIKNPDKYFAEYPLKNNENSSDIT